MGDHNVGAEFDNAGITRIVFIRHANAAPPGGKKKAEYNGIHDWQKDDQVRPASRPHHPPGMGIRHGTNTAGGPTARIGPCAGGHRSQSLPIADEAAHGQGQAAGCGGARQVV